jgi:ribosomal-protein-alanine N-acetyltransferase
MKIIETKRFIVRAFTSDDWQDVQELAVDWSKAPGPAFDKWPTSETDVKGVTDFFARDEHYYAVCLRATKKVIGLLGLNGIDANKQLDLGHVILSTYQDNDHDREALSTMVEHIFKNMDVASIVTRNEPTHAEQLAPLKTLGFKVFDPQKTGELVITKIEWENLK